MAERETKYTSLDALCLHITASYSELEIVDKMGSHGYLEIRFGRATSTALFTILIMLLRFAYSSGKHIALQQLSCRSKIHKISINRFVIDADGFEIGLHRF